MYVPSGIAVAMVTPMTESGEIDKPQLRSLVNRYIEAGLHALFPLGSSGEFFALSREEKETVAQIVIEETQNRVPVWIGSGGVTTRETVSFTKRAEEMGADAVSVITPFFLSPNEEELYHHYQKVAEATSLPIVIYNIPGRTGISLDPETLSKLSEIENIVGIKDSSGDFTNILSYIRKTGEDFAVLSGTDSLVYWTLQAGGKGGVCGLANIYPNILVSTYECWKEGNFQEAKKWQEKIEPIREAMGLDTFPSVLKAAMELEGYPVGPPREPISPISEEAEEKLKDILQFYERSVNC